jgi:butyrate kinase
MDIKRILAINPGSTSTKIAVYEDAKCIFTKNIKHLTEELDSFQRIVEQFEFRKNIIIKELEIAEIDISSIKIIVGRGGMVRPIESGIYEVNKIMIEDLKTASMQHASNLGALIADDLAQHIPGARAFIVDPVVVDELQEVARISGHPEIERISIFHALNQKAIARTHANAVGKRYDEMRMIVAHLGGGITVGAHRNGRVVDVNNGFDGDGPFSPERTGQLPSGQLVSLCFSGKFTEDQIRKMITGHGGYVAYLGTNDAYQVEQMIKEGNRKAKLVMEAMAYQVGKEIAAMAAVLHGKVDAILLTGGIAFDKDFVEYVKLMTEFIAPVVVYPGEDEMKSLAMNGLMVLRNEIPTKTYR